VVVDKVNGAPAEIDWSLRVLRQPGEKNAILKHFLGQTGLASSEEERLVKRLMVESGK
jgi:hypothetical protein